MKSVLTKTRKFLYKWKLQLFFIGLAGYLSFIALTAQPAFHYFYDSVGIRDSCVQLPTIKWNLNPSGHSIAFAAFKHIEGPGQFFVMNVWCSLVGEIFPLSPTTTAIPNIILFFLAGAVAYFFIIRKSFSNFGVGPTEPHFGFIFTLALLTSSWAGPSLRLPWVYVSLSVLLQLVIFYSLIRFFESNGTEKKKWATYAGLSYASYLYCGPDWPAFMLIVPAFMFLSGQLLTVLRSRIVWIVGFYFLAAWLAIRWLKLYRGTTSNDTIFLHVFSKQGIAFPGWERVFSFAKDQVGPVLILCFLGILQSGFQVIKAIIKPLKKKEWAKSLQALQSQAFLLTMIGWFAAASYHLFKTSVTLVYAYVIGVPLAYLAARFLVIIKPRFVAYLILAGLAGFQFEVITRNPLTYVPPEKRDVRVLAMGAYLNEKTPELLQEGKSALLIRDLAANAGHHARGKYEKIIMPQHFPLKYTHASVGNSPVQLKPIAEALLKKKTLDPDWILLYSELLSEKTNPMTYEFYQKVTEAKNVSWIVKFEDQLGRSMWLGRKVATVSNLNKSKLDQIISFNDAPVEDVGQWAKLYSEKYNRLHFLKNDLPHMLHY